MASHVDISIRVPLNSSSVAPSSLASLLPHRPSLETVSTQPVSFSISRILGFEGNPFQPPAYSLPPAYDNSTNESSKGSFREDNRQTYEHSSSVDTDNLSTDLHSVTNQSSLSTARPKMKRKQRTTFSPLEVWELERVFAQRPYLMPEDEDELVQKLGLTVRNVRFWFQNRRAKLRKQAKASIDVNRTSRPNQFDQFPLPPSPPPYSKYQPGNLFYPAFHSPYRPQFNWQAGFSPRMLPSYLHKDAPCSCCNMKSTAKKEDHIKKPV
ncbi:homeobox protein prophet of Pit-1-like [Pocillopora verrucosa]|uniref:homeobox protein prophet of Pit-1-like n=1 Tax=Pocillopora verrucosa TaxID=203993 RepID=UPI0027979973|nr:transcription factor LBX2-like [Pocillopora verrucosa]